MARVAMQRVPFVVVTEKFKNPVWRAFPELGVYVNQHYRRLVTYGTDRDARARDRMVDVYVTTSLPSTSSDVATGWPCFR